MTTNEREALLAEIAERQARLAEIDAEPDYEAWRPALEAYFDIASCGDYASTPLDYEDKRCIRGLIAALPKAPPMGKCPTCGKDYSDGLVCSDAFHLPAGTPTYWPTDEAPPMGECRHEWQYSGTDPHGSHKGEDAYRCTKCHETEYRT
jgi:hypothetical protein